MTLGTSVIMADTGRLPDASLPLIGRDAELADLERALTAPDTRLLTLTGPPGVGKTRLALAAARAVAARFGDGVVFVDLAPVQDPGLVLVGGGAGAGVARRVGRLAGRPGRHSARRQGACCCWSTTASRCWPAGPDLAALLQVCTGLRLLVTSRERLYLGAEREMPVHPLALPAPVDTADPARLAAIPAVAMLVARVRCVQPDFAVTAANAAAIAEICQRLDGLPLALELAAPRAKLFTLAELAIRLRQRMGLLTSSARDAPDRHRTLRTALEWSHDLLETGRAGAVPPAVGVRRGLDAGGGRPGVRRPGGRHPRDRRLAGRQEPGAAVRPAGRGRGVRPAGEPARVRRRAAGRARRPGAHPRPARGVLRRAGRRAGGRIGHAGRGRLVAGVHRVGRGQPASALDHCLDAGDTAAALRLAAALGWHSYFRGNLGAGRAQLHRALAAAGRRPEQPPDDVLAGALVIAGVLAWTLGELDEATGAAAPGARDQRGGRRRAPDRDRQLVPRAPRPRGRRARRGRARHEQAAVLYRRIPSVSGYAWTRYDLGLLAHRQGDLDTAARCLQDGLMLFREIDYAWAIGRCAWALAVVWLRRSEVDEAARTARRGAGAARAGGGRPRASRSAWSRPPGWPARGGSRTRRRGCSARRRSSGSAWPPRCPTRTGTHTRTSSGPCAGRSARMQADRS